MLTRQCFNPRPHAGGDMLHGIKLHGPNEGRSYPVKFVTNGALAGLRGACQALRNVRLSNGKSHFIAVSIHAPTRGATKPEGLGPVDHGPVSCAKDVLFQSAPPTRGATGCLGK